MLSKIKSLLENPELRRRLQTSTSWVDAVRLIAEAAVAEGHAVGKDGVSRLVAGLTARRSELSEQDLLAVAGGLDSKISGKKSPCVLV